MTTTGTEHWGDILNSDARHINNGSFGFYLGGAGQVGGETDGLMRRAGYARVAASAHPR